MLKSTTAVCGTVALLAMGLISSHAQALIQFDQNVTNNVIMGTGIGNGAFTTFRDNSLGLELGLRAKLRFDQNNNPQPIYNNSTTNNTYRFTPGLPPTGFSFASGSPTTPIWNFEWSINTDYTGGSGKAIDDYTYQLVIDFDPGAGTGATASFDLIHSQPFFDHSIGDNSTAQSGGTEATDAASYANLISNFSLAQNSWNYEFFTTLGTIDPTQNGTYTIKLIAFDQNQTQVGATEIDVVSIVPAPGALLLGSMGLGIVTWLRRRRSL